MKLTPYPKSILLKNGQLHIIGGCEDNGEPVSAHFSFNPLGQLVLRKALPKPRNPINGMLEHNGRIFLFGGKRSKGEWSSDCWMYKISKD